jgi:putative addiction module CopG family antidote
MAGFLPSSCSTHYNCGMDNVTLPPELERFAEEAVATGRFPDVSAVVAAGVSLLQRQEQARSAFNASLEAAEAEGEREGFVTIEEVHREINDLIDELDRAHT